MITLMAFGITNVCINTHVLYLVNQNAEPILLPMVVQYYFTLSTLQTKTYTFVNSVDPGETAQMNRLIRICTVSHSVIDLEL